MAEKYKNKELTALFNRPNPMPSGHFVRKACAYSKLLERQSEEEKDVLLRLDRRIQRKEYRAWLLAEFAHAWGFIKGHGARSCRLRYLFEKAGVGYGEGIDHREFFEAKGDIRVAVVQPYCGLDEDAIKEKLGPGDWFIRDAPEWSFYYRGRALCFLIFFAREAQERIWKKVRRQF